MDDVMQIFKHTIDIVHQPSTPPNLQYIGHTTRYYYPPVKRRRKQFIGSELIWLCLMGLWVQKKEASMTKMGRVSTLLYLHTE